MKVGYSYKRYPIHDSYDTIVIGSGIGGLSTAAIMAKEGYKVLVLERHYEAGGYTHVFKRQGYEWDIGVHYIGQVHQPFTTGSRLFRYLTEDRLKWASMGDVYDRVIINGEEYQFKSGEEAFRQQMKAYFPGEEDAIDRYLWHIQHVRKANGKYQVQKVLPSFLRMILSGWMSKDYMKYARQSTRQFLESLTNNQKLIAVLTGQYGDYGLPPSASSFMMQAIVAGHYLQGGAYPVGGASQIAKSIAPVIEEQGGDIYINAEVDQILVKGKKATGVQMKDGKEIYAKQVISNAGFMNTAQSLLPESIAQEKGFLKLANQLEPSASHICLYIGLNETADELGLNKSNIWVYPHANHDKAVQDFINDWHQPLPVVYISFPSAKDPDFENRYPGKATIEIITLAPFEWFKDWDGSQWKKRPEEYENLKEWLSQRMLSTLYDYVPQVKGKIDHYELSSPLSTKHFTNYQQGEIYGLAHTTDRFCEQFLQPKTPIKNFYLTGQDIVSCGVLGAAFGGVLTASSILNKNVISKIKKEVPKEEGSVEPT